LQLEARIKELLERPVGKEIVEKIVYQDRIVEKEKIVFRDRRNSEEEQQIEQDE